MSEERSRMSRQRVFEEALRRKSSRYTVSGLVAIGIGLLLVGAGLALNTVNITEGLLVGLGALIVIIGIIRLLIGFINPAIPEDIEPRKRDDESESLDNPA